MAAFFDGATTSMVCPWWVMMSFAVASTVVFPAPAAPSISTSGPVPVIARTAATCPSSSSTGSVPSGWDSRTSAAATSSTAANWWSMPARTASLPMMSCSRSITCWEVRCRMWSGTGRSSTDKQRAWARAVTSSASSVNTPGSAMTFRAARTSSATPRMS